MGGWISLIGDTSKYNCCIRRLKDIFNVEGVPSLRIGVHDIGRLRNVLWAWNTHKIPDVYLAKSHQHYAMLLCGVITDFGSLGQIPTDNEEMLSHILKLWIEHQDSAIQELNGSFSLLFYDSVTHEVTLFSDRFASRSVWFAEERGTWIIGNFPSAIAAIRRDSPKINPVGLWSLLHAGRPLGRHGLFDNTRCLQAGEKVTLGSKVIIRRWKNRRYIPNNVIGPKDWGKRISEALRASGSRYLTKCENPYIFLSGGLDSRVMAAALGPSLKSLTISSLPNAETRIAALVAKTLGIDHQVIIRSPYCYLETLDAAALISAGSHLTCHTHFIAPVAAIAYKEPDSEFFLADLLENFNKHYFSLPVGDQVLYDPKDIRKMLKFCICHIPYLNMNSHRWGIYIRKELREHIEERYLQELKCYAESLIDVSQNPADCFDTFLRWACVSVTPSYNMLTCLWPLAGERNIRFDNRVDDLSLEIPAKLRGAGILHRWTLQSMNKLLPLIPNANTFLPPLFPRFWGDMAKKIRPVLGEIRRSFIAKFVVRSDNKPLLTTSSSWLITRELYRKDPCYRSTIEEIISNDELFPSEIFELTEIRRTWNEFLKGNNLLIFEIDALLSFGALQRLIACGGISI